MADYLSRKRTDCRVCLSADLKRVLTLGSTPPANAFLAKNELNKPELFFPLELYFCRDCGFVQLGEIVSPELLFRNYVYVSSTSPVFVEHFRDFSRRISEKFKFPANSLIMDIGSNDGIMLRPFKESGWRVLGIDPAVKIAETATKSGIETLPEFFTIKLAEKIKEKYGQARLITATSVFPHIDDLDEIAAGIKKLLLPDGVFIIEAYYLGDLVNKNLFDTIYHEHLSYFSASAAVKILKRLGMEVFDIEKTDTHGGSLRIFSQLTGGPRQTQPSVAGFIREEKKQALDNAQTYIGFSDKIESNKEKLTAMLKNLKNQGARLAGYGAPAKGNTLLNYFDIGPEILDYIVDDSPWKQGLYTPGTHIPVVNSEELAKNRPDYLLILAWNFAEPIMKKNAAFANTGGKFIVPAPEPRII